eukprot:11832270-Alexandrium_andersonii.AAC.1
MCIRDSFGRYCLRSRRRGSGSRVGLAPPLAELSGFRHSGRVMRKRTRVPSRANALVAHVPADPS